MPTRSIALSPVINWLKAKWRSTLNDYSSDRFHAKRFFQRSPDRERISPYTGRSDRKADGYLTALIDVIADSGVKAIGASVKWDDFRSYTDGERRFMTGGRLNNYLTRWKRNGSPTKPYYTTMLGMISNVHVGIRDKEDAPIPDVTVNYVFDRQNVLDERAINTFHDVTEHLREDYPDEARMLGEIAFASSERHVQLQAADLLCYSWLRILRRGARTPAQIRRVWMRRGMGICPLAMKWGTWRKYLGH